MFVKYFLTEGLTLGGKIGHQITYKLLTHFEREYVDSVIINAKKLQNFSDLLPYISHVCHNCFTSFGVQTAFN